MSMKYSSSMIMLPVWWLWWCIYVLTSSSQSLQALQSTAIRAKSSQLRLSRTSSTTLHASNTPFGEVLLVGAAGGVAENVAVALLQQNEEVRLNLVLDRKPYSTKLTTFLQGKSKNNVRVYLSEDNWQDAVLKADTVLALDDYGDVETRQEQLDANKPLQDRSSEIPLLLAKVVNALPSSGTSRRQVISTVSMKQAKRIANTAAPFFRPEADYGMANKCKAANVPFSCLRYGELIGGVPGLEPVPIMTLPFQEPELHPSYVLQSVVLSEPQEVSQPETTSCTRDSLATCIVQMLNMQSGKGKTDVDAVIQSIPGLAPNPEDWLKLLQRAQSGGNLELLRVEFAEILKPNLFINYLMDTWYPQALIDSNAATIRSGPRPVRTTKTSDKSFQITWEDLLPDLTVKTPGTIRIELVTDAKVPYLAATRVAERSLPGDKALIDKLLEEINKSAYKKQFCTAKAKTSK